MNDNTEDNVELVADRRALIAEECFLGDYPFGSILEGIESQFRNYITTQDTSHYIDIFYSQLGNSIGEAYDSGFDADDVVEVLQDLRSKFTDTVIGLMDVCLGLGIDGYDDGTLDLESERYIITRAYEYFILNARHNFKVAIAAAIIDRLNHEIGMPPEDGLEPSRLVRINELISAECNPIITIMKPEQFLRFTGDREMIKLIEEHRLVGNFLLKYNPRLYQHESYVIEIINHTTSAMQLLGSLMAEPDPTPSTSEMEENNHGVQSTAERSNDDHNPHPNILQSGNLQSDS